MQFFPFVFGNMPNYFNLMIMGSYEDSSSYMAGSKNSRILDRFRIALKSFIGDPRILIHHAFLDETANIVADDLRIAGLTDIMDGWIAGTAYSLHYPLITEDEELKNILNRTKYKDEIDVISWREFREQYAL